MLLSEIVKEIEEYLLMDDTPYGYNILKIKRNNDGTYKFKIREGNFSTFKLIVNHKGIILDECGIDCIDNAMSAYEEDEEIINEYKNFKAKWYK